MEYTTFEYATYMYMYILIQYIMIYICIIPILYTSMHNTSLTPAHNTVGSYRDICGIYKCTQVQDNGATLSVNSLHSGQEHNELSDCSAATKPALVASLALYITIYMCTHTHSCT